MTSTLSPAFDSPPSSPRDSHSPRSPPPAPRRKEDPPLMQAIHQCDEQLLLRALDVDSGAAQSPFLDHAWEPPLCFACRVLCPAALVEILLEHGADVTATDVHGHTPLAVLSITPSSTLQRAWTPLGYSDVPETLEQERQSRSIEIAKLLLQAGANPSSAEGAGTKGRACIKLARDHANTHLMHLYKSFMRMNETQPTRSF